MTRGPQKASGANPPEAGIRLISVAPARLSSKMKPSSPEALLNGHRVLIVGQALTVSNFGEVMWA